MPLSVGTRLGPYEILAPIGTGGMGEVYKARDTKLDREVAIKVLPSALAQDPERLARFEREAKVLAPLNHPNMAAIYGVEDRALVMELVEGDSPKGPLPFDDAWKIASQIAAALEYFHERGIMHRDLKPANVKVTPDGVVKPLDFGLAKASAARLLLLDVLADFRTAGAAAGRGTVAQEFLNPPRAVDFASVQIPFPICGHHVRPMELACLAAAGSDAAQLRQILPVDDINRVVGKVGDVHAALLRIGGKVDRAGRAGRSLWSDVEFADETAFARIAVRIGTGLPRLRGPEDLHAVIAAVADITGGVGFDSHVEFAGQPASIRSKPCWLEVLLTSSR